MINFVPRRQAMAVSLIPLLFLLFSGSALANIPTAEIRLADGFDFPVGKPDGANYYRFRGFIRGDHMGEDWNGLAGGNNDLGKPVYAVAHGVVVYSKDYRSNWGNVIILRHAYRDKGTIRYVDSLYGHLNERLVTLGTQVTRGQKIGTIGTNHGMYVAHLHFEIRKNINIALKHRDYAMDFSNYHRPAQFIAERRVLMPEFSRQRVPVDCFGMGVKNVYEGPRLAALPVLPFGQPPPRPPINPVLREILARNGLYELAPQSESDKAATEERNKILNQWRTWRRQEMERDVNNDPVEPKQ
jgi:murein DD-endopeptidase MepM/ murein hydrolase activator NlpD